MFEPSRADNRSGSAPPTTTSVARRALTAGEHPGFWIASSAVFGANALLSTAQGYWALALLEGATGVMAAVAAGTVAERRRSANRR